MRHHSASRPPLPPATPQASTDATAPINAAVSTDTTASTSTSAPSLQPWRTVAHLLALGAQRAASGAPAATADRELTPDHGPAAGLRTRSGPKTKRSSTDGSTHSQSPSQAQEEPFPQHQ
jgi:hypothetical protein